MTVRGERVDSEVFVDLEGPLTVEADTHELHDLVTSVTQLGPYRLVLNLRGVPQLDCSGIGQLVQLNNQVHESGGTLRLVNVEGRQKRLLEVLGLLTLLQVCDNRQAATPCCRNATGSSCRPLAPPAASPDAVHPSIGGGLEPAL